MPTVVPGTQSDPLRFLRRLAARTIAEMASLGGQVKRGFRILLYHSVGTRLAGDHYGISIAPGLFERHVAMLAKDERITLVGLSEQPADDAGLRVAVTFDDGYKDNLFVAAPILLKYQIPFTVFVTTSFVSSGSKDYLTLAELRELAALPGVTIGSHGATHFPLGACGDEALSEELHGSRCLLEDRLGMPVTAISYPHGSVNRRVVEAARRAGYTLGACSRMDINKSRRPRLLLCRTEIVGGDSERVFFQKLAGAWDWRRWRERDPAAL